MSRVRAAWGQSPLYVHGRQGAREETDSPFYLANIYSAAILCRVLGCWGPQRSGMFCTREEHRDKAIDNYCVLRLQTEAGAVLPGHLRVGWGGDGMGDSRGSSGWRSQGTCSRYCGLSLSGRRMQRARRAARISAVLRPGVGYLEGMLPTSAPRASAWLPGLQRISSKHLLMACGGKGAGRRHSRDIPVLLSPLPGGPGASSPGWAARRWERISTKVNFEC